MQIIMLWHYDARYEEHPIDVRIESLNINMYNGGSSEFIQLGLEVRDDAEKIERVFQQAVAENRRICSADKDAIALLVSEAFGIDRLFECNGDGDLIEDEWDNIKYVLEDIMWKAPDYAMNWRSRVQCAAQVYEIAGVKTAYEILQRETPFRDYPMRPGDYEQLALPLENGL